MNNVINIPYKRKETDFKSNFLFFAAMGRKCCAPGCRSNYDNETEYITVFKFPTDPQRNML